MFPVKRNHIIAVVATFLAALFGVYVIGPEAAMPARAFGGMASSGSNLVVSTNSTTATRFPGSSLGPVSLSQLGQSEAKTTPATGQSAPSSSNYTRVLVVPKTLKDSIEWISKRLPDVDVAIYYVDDPHATLHPPMNKGHEVMVYLTYIIDHYDNLPDVIIFTHAHLQAWHNNDLLGFDAAEMVGRLNSDRVARLGYMNLRCAWDPGCPEWLHPYEPAELLGKQEQGLLAKSWSELFPFDPLPRVLGQPCCAQFAVSKERVLSIPQGRFVFYRDWLLRTPVTDYFSGRLWEFVWQYVFTGQEVCCPPEHACYCDGFGLCFGSKVQYEEYLTLRQTKENYMAELSSVQQQAKSASQLKGTAATTGSGTWDRVELGREVFLKDRIEAVGKQLQQRKLDALERGQDPRNRAVEAQ
ncbi:hypothetical protein MMC19_003315 [Ptychographa xylographoides]|nr:hypothetical protein [Ptychographa xylographoides]